MSEEPPYILDIQGLNNSPEAHPPSDGSRSWIGIRFECCGVYTRVYRNRQATAYVGRCPRCLAEVRVKIGPGGTSNRIFRAQ